MSCHDNFILQPLHTYKQQVVTVNQFCVYFSTTPHSSFLGDKLSTINFPNINITQINDACKWKNSKSTADSVEYDEYRFMLHTRDDYAVLISGGLELVVM